MRNEQPALNFTHRWERDYKKQPPSNHDYNVLVMDCIDELRTTQHTFCFNEEQKNAIIKRIKFPVITAIQDDMIVIRKQ